MCLEQSLDSSEEEDDELELSEEVDDEEEDDDFAAFFFFFFLSGEEDEEEDDLLNFLFPRFLSIKIKGKEQIKVLQKPYNSFHTSYFVFHP